MDGLLDSVSFLFRHQLFVILVNILGLKNWVKTTYAAGEQCDISMVSRMKKP